MKDGLAKVGTAVQLRALAMTLCSGMTASLVYRLSWRLVGPSSLFIRAWFVLVW